MANALDALIDRIPDEALRGQIREALKKQNQQKKFGLVFEDHIPESTVLYDVPVKAGSTVALRGDDVSKQMQVLAIDGKVAHCLSLPEKEPVDQPLDSLVVSYENSVGNVYAKGFEMSESEEDAGTVVQAAKLIITASVSITFTAE